MEEPRGVDWLRLYCDITQFEKRNWDSAEEKKDFAGQICATMQKHIGPIQKANASRALDALATSEISDKVFNLVLEDVVNVLQTLYTKFVNTQRAVSCMEPKLLALMMLQKPSDTKIPEPLLTETRGKEKIAEVPRDHIRSNAPQYLLLGDVRGNLRIQSYSSGELLVSVSINITTRDILTLQR